MKTIEEELKDWNEMVEKIRNVLQGKDKDIFVDRISKMRVEIQTGKFSCKDLITYLIKQLSKKLYEKV